MLKAQYNERGPVPQDVIDAVEFQTPELQPGEVLLAVLAAPINPSDVLTLTGEYGILPPLPAVGGNEGVGRVLEQGAGVEAPAVGQTVLLPVGAGSWSTHMVAAADELMPLPNEADAQQLAMMTVNPPTASLMLSEFVDLKAGDWVIQNVANSGVGAYLIQFAKIRGFKTVNVVRRESAVAGVEELGADIVLVDGPDLAERVAEATGKATIQLGIDAVGGEATNRLAECVGEGGTLVNYGMMSGEACVISPASFVFRDVTLRGFWLAKWFQKATAEQRMAVFGEVGELIAKGKLHTKVAATYNVSEIKEAVAAAHAGGRNGKILLLPNG
ncbi:MAG: zinc-dependent alcohol dehydrogenase family protein [Pseudomonadales bacterium]